MIRVEEAGNENESEDQIRHDAPARYLCGLTESDWNPDANTIQDFEQLLGEEGVGRLNEHVVKRAYPLIPRRRPLLSDARSLPRFMPMPASAACWRPASRPPRPWVPRYNSGFHVKRSR